MRKPIVGLLAAAVVSMLIGAMSSVFAQQGTPDASSRELEATIASLQTQAAHQKRVEATATAQAKQQAVASPETEVRMTKDGSRPLTPEEIAHDDELWAPVMVKFNTMEGWFAMSCASNLPVQPFIAEQLDAGVDLESAWNLTYSRDLNGTYGVWNGFYYEVRTPYLNALSESIGEPPLWSSDHFPSLLEFAVHMDTLYPGCSTGTSTHKE